MIATGRAAAYQLTSTVLIACLRSPDDQGDEGEVCVECVSETVLKHEIVHEVADDSTCSRSSRRVPDRRNLLTS